MMRAQRAIVMMVVSAIAIVTQLGVASAAVSRDSAPVRSFTDGSAIPRAWSTLVRNDTGATFALSTRELSPGHTITVWWVIFNHPENRSHGALGLRCGEGDLFVPSVEASVLYGAGHVIGGSGMAGYGSWIGVGETDGALFGPGLLAPFSADIHLVVHDHGVLSPDQVAEGVYNFGPCVPECVDVQFSAHEVI
jgi:hypothetical protein